MTKTMSIRPPVGLCVIFFVVLMTALLAGPLWQLPGLPYSTSDGTVHIYRGAAMYNAFEQGVFWPRWITTDYNGLGTPAFHHYSPGMYWLIAAIHRFGLRLDLVVKVIVTAALFLSGLGVYGWLRHAFSPAASLVSAAIYLVFPYLLFRSYYYVGDYPRLVALLLLPACLWATTALHFRSRIRNWLTAIVSLVALVLFHNLTTMVGGIVLYFFWVLMAICRRRPDGLLRCMLAASVAALLTSGFWLPAMIDLSQVQVENALALKYDFRTNFLHWRQLFRLHTLFLETRAANQASNLNSSGVDAVSWLVLAVGLVSPFFSLSKQRRVWGISGILIVLASLTLTLEVSAPLWEKIPGLSLIQFPFRFLSIVPLGLSPAAAMVIDVWPKKLRWLAAVFLLTVTVVLHFPFSFLPDITSTAFVPVEKIGRNSSPLYRSIGRDWGVSESNEFLIRGADLSLARGQRPEPDAAELTWHSPHEAIAEVSGHEEPLLLRLHYHPGWTAGERATLTKSPEGWVQVTGLRNPSQPLAIRWNGTQAQRWGEGLSLAGLFTAIAGLLFLCIRRRASGTESSEGAGEPIALFGGRSSFARPSNLTLGATVCCLFVLVVVRIVLGRFGGGPFVQHSPPVPAFTVEGQPAVLGDDRTSQVTLLGWKLLSSETPKPGGTVTVRLYWQANGSIKDDFQSYLHLYTPSLKRSWAVAHDNHQGDTSTRDWDPEKYYAEEMHLTLPSDLPPVTYSLVAVMSASDGNRLRIPDSEDDVLELTTLDVAPLRPSFLQKERPTYDTPADTDDGLRLRGYDFVQTPDASVLRMFWETNDVVASDWVIYAHLHNAKRDRIAQFDGPALAGLQSTSQWQTQALYIDRRRFSLPTWLEPGLYLLRIGLYSLESGDRLPLQPYENAQRHFENGQLLIPISIAPPDSRPY